MASYSALSLAVAGACLLGGVLAAATASGSLRRRRVVRAAEWVSAPHPVRWGSRRWRRVVRGLLTAEVAVGRKLAVDVRRIATMAGVDRQVRADLEHSRSSARGRRMVETACDDAGLLGMSEMVERLERLLAEAPSPSIGIAAAVALRRLGSPSADEGTLSAGSPELAAARGLVP